MLLVHMWAQSIRLDFLQGLIPALYCSFLLLMRLCFRLGGCLYSRMGLPLSALECRVSVSTMVCSLLIRCLSSLSCRWQSIGVFLVMVFILIDPLWESIRLYWFVYSACWVASSVYWIPDLIPSIEYHCQWSGKIEIAQSFAIDERFGGVLLVKVRRV